ncbi:MAG TPA: response regulator [Gaiellaceae bacterium]|jgi:DNA-binding response OmpR family regulator|nr:response regulator [Gaiellaceae bacterium]
MEAGPTALVVDDDRALRLLCRVNLELEGFRVREAATVAEAVDALEEETPDIVLLDVHLGGEPTDPLLARLREQDIPVLVVTGSVDLEEYRDRANEVLGKPFAPETLVSAARRLASIEA